MPTSSIPVGVKRGTAAIILRRPVAPAEHRQARDCSCPQCGASRGWRRSGVDSLRSTTDLKGNLPYALLALFAPHDHHRAGSRALVARPPGEPLPTAQLADPLPHLRAVGVDLTGALLFACGTQRRPPPPTRGPGAAPRAFSPGATPARSAVRARLLRLRGSPSGSGRRVLPSPRRPRTGRRRNIPGW